MYKGINIVALSETSLTNINSGEGGSNTVDIKQYIKNNEKYPYVSGQAMRYYLKSAIRRMSDSKSCIPNNEGETCGRVAECEICDLFGFMSTVKGKGARTRVSPVKVSAAMGLLRMDENSNLDLLTRKKTNDDGKSSGDIVNVELSTNIYRYGISIDVARVGSEEEVKSDDVLKYVVEIKDRVSQDIKKDRIVKTINAVRNITDYSKQSRLLTDFTPDFVLISLDKNYTHRLQKAIEIDESKNINIERLKGIIEELISAESKVLMGSISGCVRNLDEVKEALKGMKVECLSVKEAFDKAIELL